MRHGFMYLTAVIDWYSRYVLSWRLSNTLEGQFCLEALDESLAMGLPEIFNTDLGSQFTAQECTGRLEEAGIAVSRDGWGRALDNVFVERLWWSVKYEEIYIENYKQVPELESGLRAYFWFYDEQHPHQSLAYRTPGEVYRAGIHGGERGKALTNAGGPSGPPFGVHYNELHEISVLPLFLDHRPFALDGERDCRRGRGQSRFSGRSGGKPGWDAWQGWSAVDRSRGIPEGGRSSR